MCNPLHLGGCRTRYPNCTTDYCQGGEDEASQVANARELAVEKAERTAAKASPLRLPPKEDDAATWLLNTLSPTLIPELYQHLMDAGHKALAKALRAQWVPTEADTLIPGHSWIHQVDTSKPN